jgi:CRISPR-associated protein Csm2
MSQYDERRSGSQGPRPGQGYQPRYAQPQQPFPKPSDAVLRSIVLDGDGRALVESAQAVGRALKEQGLTSSQIRGIFGSVRVIQAKWPVGADGPETDSPEAKTAMRQLLLLKPKLAYQATRDNSGAVGRLAEVLGPAIDLVTTRRHLQHLADYFEAILAYHKAAGGRD